MKHCVAIGEIVERQRFSYAVTPNVDHTVKASQERTLQGALLKSFIGRRRWRPPAMGRAITWHALERKGQWHRPLRAHLRIRGPAGIFRFPARRQPRRGRERLCRAPAPPSRSENCRLRVPALWILQARSRTKRSATIRESGADILFVGLGAPQQEQWMCDFAKGSGVSFAIGVGVSFSFVGGLIAARSLMDAAQRAGMALATSGKNLAACPEDICWRTCHSSQYCSAPFSRGHRSRR